MVLSAWPRGGCCPQVCFCVVRVGLDTASVHPNPNATPLHRSLMLLKVNIEVYDLYACVSSVSAWVGWKVKAVVLEFSHPPTHPPTHPPLLVGVLSGPSAWDGFGSSQAGAAWLLPCVDSRSGKERECASGVQGVASRVVGFPNPHKEETKQITPTPTH